MTAKCFAPSRLVTRCRRPTKSWTCVVERFCLEFIDAHGHVMDLGFAALHLDLTGSTSLAELQQRLRAYAATHRSDPWLIGFGWNQELWPDKTFPTAADLDAVVSDRPVVLERVDGHAVIANSAAIRAAGVTEATPVPPGAISRRVCSSMRRGT